MKISGAEDLTKPSSHGVCGERTCGYRFIHRHSRAPSLCQEWSLPREHLLQRAVVKANEILLTSG